MMPKNAHVAIIGAGPAGLTAAYELTRHGYTPQVLEKGERVGGISRTEVYKGYHFDIGGHRFYTKVDEISRLWHEVMGEDFLKVPRLSRILYDGKFYRYPLQLRDTVFKLGMVESALILWSYLRAQVNPYPVEDTFEQYVVNRFGRRLYDRFFRIYTEKVWGIPCNQIRADWAAQRIKGLSMVSAVRNALFNTNGGDVKSLIEEFHYPPLGPGMMWEQFRTIIEARGASVRTGVDVREISLDGKRVSHIVTRHDGETSTRHVDTLINSMALRQLIDRIDPAPPPAVVDAAHSLQYRDFIMVCLIVDAPDLFPDNWLYIHSPQVRVGRVQNFKNWSSAMLPDPTKTSIGMEYFCSKGDDLWSMTDADLLALAATEMQQLGLASASMVEDGTVVRQLRAYPTYDEHYMQNVGVIRHYLDGITNLQTIGRNGLHRYNNQDHSMLTGLLAARNLMGESHDLWSVNTERSYYEEFATTAKQPAPTAPLSEDDGVDVQAVADTAREQPSAHNQ